MNPQSNLNNSLADSVQYAIILFVLEVWAVSDAISSVIWQKSESQNLCFKKTKHAKVPKKREFLTPWHAHICTCPYQGVRNVRVSENLAFFVFLKHPLWDSPFCLITDDLKKLFSASDEFSDTRKLQTRSL